jgi:hypothetical protein
MGVCGEKSDFSRTGTADLSFCGNKLNLLINALKGFRDRNPFFLRSVGILTPASRRSAQSAVRALRQKVQALA